MTLRAFFAAALVAFATALPAPASAPQAMVVPRLSAKVTGSTISLKSAGTRISSIPQNTYTITVSDSTTAQTLHLIGPGVNHRTGVAATGRTSWRLALDPGKYVYRSDRNGKLRGSFTVTPVPPA